MADDYYPIIDISVNRCDIGTHGAQPVAAKPIGPTRSMKEISQVSARIKAITQEKEEEKEHTLTKVERCAKCFHLVDPDTAVTDTATGKVYCPECYDKL